MNKTEHNSKMLFDGSFDCKTNKTVISYCCLRFHNWRRKTVFNQHTTPFIKEWKIWGVPLVMLVLAHLGRWANTLTVWTVDTHGNSPGCTHPTWQHASSTRSGCPYWSGSGHGSGWRCPAGSRTVKAHQSRVLNTKGRLTQPCQVLNAYNSKGE